MKRTERVGKLPASQGSRGRGWAPMPRLEILLLDRGFYLGREELLVCVWDGRGGFLHLPGNVARLGSGVPSENSALGGKVSRLRVNFSSMVS